MECEHLDVIVIGAGLSGVGAAWHLKHLRPQSTFAVLEARQQMGGTWDLFRYPGVRSDSDMFTLGYRFEPWRAPQAIADGASIREYIRATADRHGITPHVRFGHRVTKAEWSSTTSRWLLHVEHGNASSMQMTCNFLFTCTGYYDYAAGYTPHFEGVAEFRGRIVHPQQWPEDLDFAGKRIVVIGSGATAVTLVPAMAQDAAHVTMLQRSPTYMLNRSSRDPVADTLRRFLPERAVYAITRWKNVLLGMGFFTLSRRLPEFTKRLLTKGVQRAVTQDVDVATHFSPRYNPWDQRLCLVPDSDLFQAINRRRASIVTEEIDHFTPNGVRLRSGVLLEADIIVTATGLTVQLLGGIPVVVDGRRVNWSETLMYKGMMYSDVPNLASAFGYTNASWTLKCDLTSQYVCRLLDYMQQHGFTQCTPRRNDPSMAVEPVLDFTSGYVQRAMHTLPKQGSQAPWRVHQNYISDLRTIRKGRIDDGTMEFR
jgi:monooxygenase